MNIIFVIPSTFPDYTGGIENWLYNVSAKLVAEHDIYIISEKPNTIQKEICGSVGELSSKINLIRTVVPQTNTWVYKILYHSYMVPLCMEFEKKALYKQLIKILSAHTEKLFYVISLDTIYTAHVVLKAREKYKNIFFINSVRGPHAELTSMNYPLLEKYFYNKENDSLRRADQVWANGYDTGDALLKRGYESIVIKNGVDCKRSSSKVDFPSGLKPYNCDLYLLTIGTVYDVKGYRELIDAIAIVKNKYSIRVGMTSFGKGNPLKYIEQAKKLGIDNQILFAGVQNKTIEYGKHFDVIACLSCGSGLSMACLESMATGKPVIAWNSPVYTQMITNGSNGLLVEEKNASELADAIYWIYANPVEAARLGEKGAARALEFDWSVIVSDIENSLTRISE